MADRARRVRLLAVRARRRQRHDPLGRRGAPCDAPLPAPADKEEPRPCQYVPCRFYRSGGRLDGRLRGRPPRPRTAFGTLPRRQGRLFGHLADRSEEHTSELQSLMRISYAVFCLIKTNRYIAIHTSTNKL